MEIDLELVENLLKRIEQSPQKNGFMLQGLITDREQKALRLLADHVRSQIEPDQRPSAVAPTIVNKASLNTKSLDAKIDDTTILCLDFGTAFSKAAATDATEKLIEIGLGRAVQEVKQPYLLQSSLFIENDRIWFGPQAIDVSNKSGDPGRSRFDSPKQEMSQGDLEQLHRQPVGSDVNPSSVQFSKGDLIQLYLAYLTDLTYSVIRNQGIKELPTQRFSRPCWPQERANLADRAFRDMLAKALIIGDTLHGQWSDGLHIKAAKSVLDSAKLLGNYPQNTEGKGILEATAAANSVLKGLQSESLFLVVDIGAGTCDFGLFFVRNGRRIAEVKDTTQVLRQAGDRVDGCLVRALLDKAYVTPDSDEGRRMQQRLKRDGRGLKEALFENQHVSYTLQNDQTVDIVLDEFCRRDDLNAFVTAFKIELHKSLAAPQVGTYARTNNYVDVMLTGGGSRLPFLRVLFQESMDVAGHGRLHFRLRQAEPDWLSGSPVIAPFFPQLAVAIGGAQEELPDQRNSVSDIVPPAGGTPVISAIYKS